MKRPATTVLVIGGVIIGTIGTYIANNPDPPPLSTPAVSRPDTLTVCTFNVKWSGSYKNKDNAAIADLLAPYDIVVIQELVAPAVSGRYPDGTEYIDDPEARAFVDAIGAKGFDFLLSAEDTGPGSKHSNSSTTEWFVCFFKPDKCFIATDLPIGSLASDRFGNDVFDRVPYAFPFRSKSGAMDFVLISVHLVASPSASDRRKQELSAIAGWVDEADSNEKDFIVLGDMNIQSVAELTAVSPDGFSSLNDECRKTTTGASLKPYDHVMFRRSYTSEIDSVFDCAVLDLVDSMKSRWKGPGAYCGAPYDGNLFPQCYSDHNPVVFRIIGASDDDGRPAVTIAAALPNPDGEDAGKETVTLRNGGSAAVDVSGWRLKDRSGKTVTIGGSIDAGGNLVVTLPERKMPLDNANGDDILLFDAGNTKVHQVTYTGSQAKAGAELRF